MRSAKIHSVNLQSIPMYQQNSMEGKKKHIIVNEGTLNFFFMEIFCRKVEKMT